MNAEARRIWDAVAAATPSGELRSLRDGLARLDPALCQGQTMRYGWDDALPREAQAVKAACAVCYGAWRNGARTFAQVDDRFAAARDAVARATGEGSEIRHFTGWFDSTPLATVAEAMLPLIDAELARRTEHAA